MSTESLAEGTLISHLLELRNRLVKAFLAVLVVFIPSGIFRMSPFITPFKMAFFFAVFAAMPVVLYQIWAFVAPGLYRKEKRFAVPLLLSSIVLFYVGTAFAYKLVFPLAFHFFAGSAPAGVQVMPDINDYLDFALTMFFAFGLAFEVPVVVVLLTLTGLVTVEKLTEARGYVIIGICVVAAVITPPDPLSMGLMAIPMWLLYEAGVVFARVLNSGRSKDDETPATDSGGTGAGA
jgi:sec-independent protein translocase protein TatC